MQGASFRRVAREVAAIGVVAAAGLVPAWPAPAASPASSGDLDAVADRAAALVRAGEFAKARDAWQAALSARTGKPGWPRAAYEVARLDADRLGAPKAANALMRRIVREAPASLAAPQALRFLAFGHPAGRARAVFYRSEAQRRRGTPLFAIALYGCGEEARAHALYGLAVGCYRTLVHDAPTSVLVDDALLHAADAYRAAGNLEAATQLYTWVVLGPPGDHGRGPFPSSLAPEALFALGEMRMGPLHDPAGALHAFRQILDGYPASRLRDDAWARIARIEARRGDDGAARSAWKHLLAETPTSRYAREARAALK